MENKELPTIQEYMITYLESQPLFPKYDRWIDFALGCPKPILFAHYEAVIENYAQLVAESHVQKALEAAAQKATLHIEQKDEMMSSVWIDDSSISIEIERDNHSRPYWNKITVNKESILNAYKV